MVVQKTKVDLDLDAIRGRSKTVRLRGKIIEIPPVSLEDFFDLRGIIEEFQSVNVDDVDIAGVGELLRDFQTQIEAIIPGLEGIKCSLDELMAIVNLAFDSAKPKDQEELAKRKITPKDHQKKVVRTTRS